MQQSKNGFWGNTKVFAVSWLTASLLFPLFASSSGADYSYSWGVAMMLLGVAYPYILLPALAAAVLLNWVVTKNQKWFNSLLSLVILGGAVSGLVFMVTFLARLLFLSPGAGTLDGLVKLVTYTGIGGMIYGFYYYLLLVKKTMRLW